MSTVVEFDAKSKREVEKAIDALSKRIGDSKVGLILACIDKDGEATVNIVRLTKLEALGLTALTQEMIINTEEEDEDG